MAFGLRPAKGPGTGHGYNTGGFSEYRIDVSAVGTNIFAGDFVELTATGEVVRQNGSTGESPTTTNRTIGVFMGCRYVDADGTPKWAQYYTDNTSNTEAYAFVADDPNQVFEIESDGATTFADIGMNAPVAGFAASSGSTTTGNSGVVLDHSLIATTNSLALRIVGVPEDGENEDSSTPIVHVRLNAGVNQLSNATGL